MNQQVFWIFEFSINDAELDNLKALMKEMVDSTKANEPGTIAYEWYIGANEKDCHVYERYRDSAATVTHLKTFKTHYAARLMSLGKATRFVVYGNPDSTVHEELKGFGAVFMTPLGEFANQ